MTIYERIRYLRKEMGMTQDELAQKLGYKDRTTITRIESGQTDISQKKIIAIADALMTTPAYLMGWSDDPVLTFSETLNVDEEFIISSFRKLDSAGKTYIMTTMTMINKYYEDQAKDTEAEKGASSK